MELTPTQQLDQAEELIDAKKFVEAEAIYKSIAAAKGPNALLAKEELVDLYLRQNKLQQAETAYEQLLIDFADNPLIAKAIDHVADDYRGAGDFEKARELYQHILNTFPDADHAIDSQRGIVLTSMLLGDSEFVNQSLDKLIEDYGNHPDIGKAMESIADEFRSNRRYTEARELYLYVIDNHPESEHAVSSLGGAIRMSFLLKDDPNAEALTEQLLSQYADNEDLPSVYDEVADEYRHAGKFEKARDLYSYAVTAWPKIDRALESRKSVVLCSIALNDEPNALADLDQLITEFNTTGTNGETADRSALLTDVLVKIAKGYEQAKMFDQAKDIYQQIKAKDPNSTNARFAELNNDAKDLISLIHSGPNVNVDEQINKLISDYNDIPQFADVLARIAEETFYAKNYQKSAQIFKLLSDKYADSNFEAQNEIPYMLGSCYKQLRDPNMAIAYLTEAYEKTPDCQYSYRLCFEIGLLCRSRSVGRYEEAVEWFSLQRQFSENKGQNKEALFFEAVVHLKNLKNYNKAKELLLEYQAKYPNDSETELTQFLLAECYEAVGDKAKALSLVKQGLQKWPESIYADDYKKKLDELQ